MINRRTAITAGVSALVCTATRRAKASTDTKLQAIVSDLHLVGKGLIETDPDSHSEEYKALTNREIALIETLIKTPARSEHGRLLKLEWLVEGISPQDTSYENQLILSIARDLGIGA